MPERGLIDWDTAALARPERDLWMLDDGTPECLRLHPELAGHTISGPAMEFCRLAWTLSDIASFVQMFRSPHRETRWLGTSSPGFSISSRESHQRLTAARNGDSGNAHRQFSPPARRQADLHELDSRSAL